MKAKRTAALLALCVLATFGREAEVFAAQDAATPETELSEEIAPHRGNCEGSLGSRCRKKKCTDEESAKTTAAGAGKAFNWYCQHRSGGEQPPIPSEMAFVEEHGGYFLDRTVSDDAPVIYLTFDAGYENGNVAKILDALKAENVPAAFFILEHLVTKETALVKRMAEEGHLVCNHTARHGDMSAVTDKESFGRELAALEEVYKAETGYDMAKYYRPPEGRFSETNLIHAEELGYRTVFWSFAYADWDNNRQMSADAAFEKVMGGIHNGEVLLLHPTSATNAEILPRLIRALKEKGYRFGTLDELTEG